MIEKFVRNWELNKQSIRAAFEEKHPDEYIDIVREVIVDISDEDDYYSPSAARIHQINDGDYQGTLLFVIGAKGYQPSDYWYVMIGYGSCSGCDTLQRIRGYDYDQKPTKEQVDDYMVLALHVVQQLKAMGESYV
jgi:hypothetical protein